VREESVTRVNPTAACGSSDRGLAHARYELLAPGVRGTSGESDVLRAEVHRGHLSELRYRVERALVHLRVGLLAGQRTCAKLIS
jgi:hypothetical protein